MALHCASVLTTSHHRQTDNHCSSCPPIDKERILHPKGDRSSPTLSGVVLKRDLSILSHLLISSIIYGVIKSYFFNLGSILMLFIFKHFELWLLRFFQLTQFLQAPPFLKISHISNVPQYLFC